MTATVYTAEPNEREEIRMSRAAATQRIDPHQYNAGFWWIAFAFAIGMGFSTVPAPLYPLYQLRDGFSTFMVTIVFAAYVVGVLTSLVLAGHGSDWAGRKKVLAAALALEVVAAILFLTDPSLRVLITARLVTGLGVGMLTPAATAFLQELNSRHRMGDSRQRFEIVSTGAQIGGLGVGPLIAGILAQYLDAPLVVPYVVFGALLFISIAGVARTPETVHESAARPTYRPVRDRTGHANPHGYVAASTAGFACFAVFGLFTSLAPAFLSGTLHQPSRALAGLIVFAVFTAAAAAQTLTGRFSAPARRAMGLLGQAGGVIVLAVGMYTANLVAFLLGGIVAGSGAGVLFKSAVGAVAAMAEPARRGEALAGLFLISFLGMAVPAVGIGVATLYTTAADATTWFAVLLIALLALAGVLGRQLARPSPGHAHGLTPSS